MSRELLKRAVVVLHDHFDGVNWVQPLLNDIDNELAQPEPEPVAWKDATYGNLHHVNYGDSMPLYAEPVDQSARIAKLEKDNNIMHENLAWYMEKYHEHLTISAKEVYSIEINHE